MKLKRFNQFIKENIGEELPGDEFDSPEELKRHIGSEELSEEDFDLDDDDFDDENIEEFNDLDDKELSEEDFNLDDEEDDSEFNEINLDEEVEEEGAEYIGTVKMKELARELGSNVQNNEINYNGKKINYYSEDEKFHIGREKFETIEEVLDFLNKGEKHGELEDNV